MTLKSATFNFLSNFRFFSDVCLDKLCYYYYCCHCYCYYCSFDPQGEFIQYTGDPLQDFTLIRFLDRFVFRNPKQTKGKRKQTAKLHLVLLNWGLHLFCSVYFLYSRKHRCHSDAAQTQEDVQQYSVITWWVLLCVVPKKKSVIWRNCCIIIEFSWCVVTGVQLLTIIPYMHKIYMSFYQMSKNFRHCVLLFPNIF